MRYADFEIRIAKMASEASAENRLRFALDSVALLRASAKSAIESELNDTEQHVLIRLLDNLANEPVDRIRPVFRSLDESMTSDPVRAIEFDPSLTDLLCAIEALLDYRETGAPACIEAIAIHRVNSIDYTIGGQSEEYSIDNVLGAPEMQQEYRRQEQLLLGGAPSHLPLAANGRHRPWWKFW